MFKLTKFKQLDSLSSGVLTQPLPRSIPVSTKPINQHFPISQEGRGPFHLRRGEADLVCDPTDALEAIVSDLFFSAANHCLNCFSNDFPEKQFVIQFLTIAIFKMIVHI